MRRTEEKEIMLKAEFNTAPGQQVLRLEFTLPRLAAFVTYHQGAAMKIWDVTDQELQDLHCVVGDEILRRVGQSALQPDHGPVGLGGS